jgi:hypothetical protein
VRISDSLFSKNAFERFYEKVIKVKADVAALLIFFVRHGGSPVAW